MSFDYINNQINIVFGSFFSILSPHSFFNAYQSDVGHLRLLQYFCFSVLLILLFLIIILFLREFLDFYVLVLLLIKKIFFMDI